MKDPLVGPVAAIAAGILVARYVPFRQSELLAAAAGFVLLAIAARRIRSRRLAAVCAALALFAVSCAASSFAFVAVFIRFANTRMQFFEGLTKNAYGIFLVHFVFVSWLGYAMLGFALPAILKFLVVFAGSLALSWVMTIWIRRIPGVARVM